MNLSLTEPPKVETFLQLHQHNINKKMAAQISWDNSFNALRRRDAPMSLNSTKV